MNAIISFCHFCEHHGPSVVFCTQAYKENNEFDNIKSNDPSAEMVANDISLNKVYKNYFHIV